MMELNTKFLNYENKIKELLNEGLSLIEETRILAEKTGVPIKFQIKSECDFSITFTAVEKQKKKK